jgi:hypothetical protein
MQHTQSAINIHAHAIFTNAMFWLNGEKHLKTSESTGYQKCHPYVETTQEQSPVETEWQL